MGAVNGKGNIENEGPPPVSGIRVTDGLVRQLKNEREAEPPAQRVMPGGPLFPFYRPAASFPPQTRDDGSSSPADVQTTSQTSSSQPVPHEDASASEPSTSHKSAEGDDQAIHQEVQQLAQPKALKAEAASQEQVKQYADQLAEEYETPLKYLPCQEEKTSCLECYQHHQKDPLRCASQVEAFTQCARRASAAMVS